MLREVTESQLAKSQLVEQMNWQIHNSSKGQNGPIQTSQIIANLT